MEEKEIFNKCDTLPLTYILYDISEAVKNNSPKDEKILTEAVYEKHQEEKQENLFERTLEELLK